MVELAGIIILGILAQWLAWKLKLPAILPLILVGLAVGPFSTLISENGEKWIEPVWNGTRGLFVRDSLFYFVSLAISIILFEGGLTLNKKEVLNVGPAILKLITLGSVITFFGAGLAVRYLFNLDWSMSFLFSSLIIVTGPTVISPILRNTRLKSDVSAILKWEGILIDPIGALVAVLVFEFISVDHVDGFTKTAIMEFGKIVLFGFTFGFTFAHAFNFIVQKQMLPKYLLNVFTLAYVLGVFVLSDVFAKESGLLSVVVMGMVLGNIDLPELKEILHFKEALTILLISILFIVLSANMNMEDFYLIYNWETLMLFGVVILVIRPLGVFLSTYKSGLKFKDKVFISWVGPRGIVAAGIASLFGLKLMVTGVKGAEYITPLVFLIVLGTVLLNATTARFVARVLKVNNTSSKGVLIVGASLMSRLLAKYLNSQGTYVIVIDNNEDKIKLTKELALNAEVVDVFKDDISNNLEYADVGHLFALTGSKKVNEQAISIFSKNIENSKSYRLVSETELSLGKREENANLVSFYDDFINISDMVRDYPEINEVSVVSYNDFKEKAKQLIAQENTVPVILLNQGNICSVPNVSESTPIGPKTKLIYFGKPFYQDQYEE